MGAESEAGKAVAEMTVQVAGLQRAAADAGSAAQRAGGVVASAQRAGFDRVAAQMAQAQSQLQQVAVMFGAAAEQVEPGQAAAGEVTAQTDPDKAISKLQVTVKAADAAQVSTVNAVGEADKASATVTQAMNGSNPGAILAMLQSVRKGAAESAKHGQQAKKHAEAAMDSARTLDAGGGGSGN